MKQEWVMHSERTKYVLLFRPNQVYASEIYITLDGKFHSWGTRKTSRSFWHFRTPHDPDVVTKSRSGHVWLQFVSGREILNE